MRLYNFKRFSFKGVKWGDIFQVQRTETHQNIPAIYREPGILTGYRLTGRSWFYYAASVFQFHNETVNIWTHAIATFIFIQKLLFISKTNDHVKGDCELLPFVFFVVCATANSFLSSFAHTFHSKSSLCHYICFLLDYSGIGLYALGQSILFLYVLCPNNVYELLGWFALPLNVCLSWVVMTGSSLSKLLYRRPYPFKRRLIQLGSGCIHASFASIPLVSRMTHCLASKDCNIVPVCYHFGWIVTMVICLVFFSSHLPEKKAPGKFDIIGQGHQVFHVFQTITVLLQFRAVKEDAMSNDGSVWSCHHVSARGLLSAFTVYVLGCVIIILLSVKLVKKRIETDKKFS